MAKVVPTPNNGFTEMVQLAAFNRGGETHYFFLFQKIKYIWDAEKKTFRGVDFPISHHYGKYMESKGLQDDEEISRSEQDYGSNQ